MAIFELLSLLTFISFIHSLALRHHYLTIWSNRSFCTSPMYFIIKFPKLNNPIIRGEHLYHALFVIDKFYGIYLFVQLYRFEMIKLRLMTLYLGIISVVEVPWILQLNIFENNHSSSLVAHCQIFTCFIEIYGRQNIIFTNTLLITFSEPVNVHPIWTISNSIRINLWLARFLSSKIWWRETWFLYFVNVIYFHFYFSILI